MKDNSFSIITYSGNLLSIGEVIRIEEIENETYLVLTDGSRSKSVLSIDVLERELPENEFIRVHPSHIINKAFSKKLFVVHTQWIELENGEKIPLQSELTKSKNLFHKTRKK